MDKEVFDSPDAFPERETWRRNKKQRAVSQSRESLVSPAKRRRVFQPEHCSFKFPLSRPVGQQHVFPIIPVQSQSNPGMFYPPHTYPYQHMRLNSPKCDSGLGNCPVPLVRASMAPPTISMASVQNRKSSRSNSDADGDQESQG